MVVADATSSILLPDTFIGQAQRYSLRGGPIPENQHYVPQFVLRNFRGRSGTQVHVFDKHTMRSYKAAPSKIAAEKGFYDIPESGGASLEPALGTIESRASEILASVVTRQSLEGLTREDRRLVAIFCTAQFIRVPHFRNTIGTLRDLMNETLARLGFDPDAAGMGALTQDQIKAMGLLWFKELPSFLPYFENKDWILYRSPVQDVFYTSDNPIVMHNDRKTLGLGGNGLGVPGIQLHMPLSGSLTLAMLCPTIRTEIEGALDRIGVQELPSDALQARDRLSSLATDLRESGTRLVKHENVTHLNSLQVGNSARFVYSGSANFDLVREMLHKHPELRTGTKPTVG